MQLSSFLPAGPAPSAPGGQSGRNGSPREQGFDAVYEAGERRPPASDTARDGAEADRSVRRSNESADTETPQRADKSERAEGAPPREEASEAEAAPIEETEIEATAGLPAPKAAEDLPVSERADTAVADAPEEASLAVAEATTRQPHAGTSDAAEEQRPAKTVDPQAAQAKAAAPETPAATNRAETAAPAPSASSAAPETAAPPAASERNAPPPAAAEAAQQRAAATPPAAEEVVVRRIRTDQPAEATDAEAPRADARPREVEVKAPKPAIAAAMPETAVRPAAEMAAHVAADPLPIEASAGEVRSTAEHVARAEATVRHDTPRPVMQQVAEAARALRDGPVELMMQPEELGKVRMTLTAGADGNMTMSLQAERSETLDLLRRHIGELARELRDMGFSNLNFSFDQDRTPSGGGQHAGGGGGETSDRPVATVPLASHSFAARPNMTSSSGGLDLRL